MNRAAQAFFLLLIAVGWLWHCGGEKNQPEVPGHPKDSVSASTTGAVPGGVELLDEAGYDSLITHREGKVLIVNFWATWCIPCRDEFPELVRLRTHFAGAAVDVVGISIDYPDEIEEKVKPFLKQVGANFPIYVLNVTDVDSFIQGVHPDWSGALPATFVYDRKGSVLKFLLGQQNFDQFRAAVQEVLKVSR